MGRYILLITPMLQVALLWWLYGVSQRQVATLTDSRQGGDTELLLRQHGGSAVVLDSLG